jgi:3-oxoacyl-(acyl-carrier-protein) synthase
MSVATPLGIDVDTFWQALVDGRSGIRAWPEYDDLPPSARMGGRVTDFDPETAFTRRERMRLSRASQLALLAGQAALAQSGLTEDGFDGDDAGVVLGTSIGVVSASEAFLAQMGETGICDPLAIPTSMNLAPAANLSIRHRLRGPLMTIDAACASAGHAIGQAFHMVRGGQVRAVVTGGADSPFSPFVLNAWSSLQALSRRIDDPPSACRPFSADRDGFVLGEHAAILVIEDEESARSRGAAILAEISGYGASSDAEHLTQPSVDGLSRAMQRALDDARLQPGAIHHINAHGTGTFLNDKAETAAIHQVFGNHAFNIPVVSIKPAVGHSFGASSAVELVACIQAIREGLVPPTINYRVFDDACDLDYVTGGAVACDLEHVMSNSFAFGGSNAVLIVSRYRG